MFVPVEYQRKQIWREKFPTGVGGFLSIFQLILTITVIGCEIPTIFFHFPRMNAFVGYWAFPFFMCAWISLAGLSCCCQHRCCGVATVVFQVLTILVSLSVIGLDAYFLNYPLQCFFSDDCNSYYYTYGSSSNYYNYYGLDDFNTLYSIRLPLVKGQLATGVLMFLSCVIYIIIFGIVNQEVQKTITNSIGPTPPVATVLPPNHYNPVYPNPVGITKVVSTETPQARPPVNLATRSTVPNTTIICPHCRTNFQVSA